MVAGNLGRAAVFATSGASADESALGRLDFYRQALEMVEESPLVGYGIGAFGYMADGLKAAGIYPHNMFLEILVDGGFLGLALFTAFSWPLIWSNLRSLLRADLSFDAAALAGLTISSLLRHQFSMSVMTGKVLFFALGCAAARIVYREASAAQVDPGQGSAAKA